MRIGTPGDGMEDRAVSTTLGYALTLGISTLLITGLVLTGGTYIENQREQAIRTELNVLGNQVASDVQSADRLVLASGGTGSVTVQRDLPKRVAGATYTLTVQNAGSDPHLKLESGDPEVTVQVDVVLMADLTLETSSPLQGGSIEVVSRDTTGGPEVDKLVIRRAG